MKGKLTFLALVTIFLLCLQYGNQATNTNVGTSLNSSDFKQFFAEKTSTTPIWNVELSTPTLIEGKIGTNPIPRTTVGEWQSSPAGFSGNQISVNGKIAYVWMENFALAATYKALFELNGHPTDLISVSELSEGIFNGYDLILIGDDTGYNKAWGTEPGQAAFIASSQKPIIGFGEGGYAFFGQLNLNIGCSLGNQGIHGNLDSITIIDDTHRIFNSPNDIGSGTVKIFSESRSVSLHFSTLPETVVLLGSVPSSDQYPLVLEQDNYLLWGFREGPSYMTPTGTNLLVNCANYLLRFLDPINIDENADFAALGFPGSGTAADPYLIDGFRIIASSAPLIHIQDTDAYFKISNTLFDGIDGSYTGINLLRVTHGLISENNIVNCNYGISLQSSNEVVISNNLIDNNWGTGISFENSSYNVIEYNTVSNNGVSSSVGEHGIHLIVPSTYNTINNNLIFNNDGDGIYLEHCDNNVISGNTIHHNQASAVLERVVRSIGHGVFLNPSNGNTIIHNDVYANGVSGIALYLSNYTDIVDNFVHENTGNGVQIQFSNYNTIDQNLVGFNGGAETKIGSRVVRSIGHGVFLNPSTHNIISNNEVYNNYGDGVYLYHSNDNTIAYNTIHHNDADATMDSTRVVRSIGHGVFLNPSNGNTIIDNDVFANGDCGIGLLLSNYTNIENNYVHENGANGVQLQYSNYNTIDHNLIGNNGGIETKIGSRVVRSIGHGVFLNPSTHNTISNNEIYNNYGDGVYLYHSNDNTIARNAIHHNDADATLDSSRVVRSIGHGVFLNPSNGNTIVDNDVFANGDSGIGLLYSNYTNIENNYVHQNGYNGVQLQHSNENVVQNNLILQNGASSSSTRVVRSIGHGVFLNPSVNNHIINNTISGNSGNGIELKLSNNTLTIRNTVSNNSLYGINITQGAEDNLVALNNFENNNADGTSQAINNGDKNTFVYNYWADHLNDDLDGDGIADSPYSIDGAASSQDIAGVTIEITETGHFLMAPIILFPTYHDKISESAIISWLPAVDSYGHSVTYDFWYSPDAGKTWILEAVDLTSCNYVWDISQFKSGSRYMIRIVATCSEGLVAEDQSDKFEIFMVKKATFDNTDTGLLAIRGFATMTTELVTENSSLFSLLVVVLSVSSVILYRKYRKTL